MRFFQSRYLENHHIIQIILIKFSNSCNHISFHCMTIWDGYIGKLGELSYNDSKIVKSPRVNQAKLIRKKEVGKENNNKPHFKEPKKNSIRS